MAEVRAADVAALRKATGAGMMDCKHALTASDGDIEAAKQWLREKGKAGAATRASRAADQGAIGVVVQRDSAAMVELNCETDFVAKGDDFRVALERLTTQVLAEGDDDLADQALDGGTVADFLVELSARLGEKIELGRTARLESIDGLLDGYRHVQNERGTIGVLVELGGVDRGDAKAVEVAHDVALHIASAAPTYVNRTDVPEDVVAKEREVFEALTRNEGKPDKAVPKIVEGRLNGFFKASTLLEQPFVREPKTTIAALVATLGDTATVRRFVRAKIGEV